jgi:DNA-binding LacI/PurR family transcriptional regulator
MVTIADVARAAGVGVGTVSRVLNGSLLVAPSTRHRVLVAIERLGYQPSPIARAFGRRRTEKLEVLIPLYAHNFALEIFRGVQDALVDTDYTLMLRTISDTRERDRVLEECCLRGRSDGVLVVWMAATEPFVERIRGETFPAVLVNARYPGISSVGVDHDAAAERAVDYCAGLGHSRIALVDRRADPFDVQSAGICEPGYQKAVGSIGSGARPEYQRLADPSAAAGAAAVDELLALEEPPSAIIAASEAQAIGVLSRLRERGQRVPEDVGVIGYNDSPLVEDLGLTTMGVPLRELARAATETLLANIAEPATLGAIAEERLLPAELVVRRTCGPPPPRARI